MAITPKERKALLQAIADDLALRETQHANPLDANPMNVMPGGAYIVGDSLKESLTLFGSDCHCSFP